MRIIFPPRSKKWRKISSRRKKYALQHVFALSSGQKHVIKHTFGIVRNTTRKLYEIQLLLHFWSAFCNKIGRNGR